MAARIRRLGSFLSDLLLDALAVLDETAAPRGREAAAAHALRDWCAARWPDIEWAVEYYSADGANLVASCGAGPLLYSHLDTSLDGGPGDALITGRDDDPGRLQVLGNVVKGFGVGVARAPAAAALVAFTGARRGTLLLAGSGTHRRDGHASGVEFHLDHHPAPPSAVIAKCGPPAILRAEPGAAYLRIVVTGKPGIAMAPESAVPRGGVVARSGAVVDMVGRWWSESVAGFQSSGQAGRELGIGAIRAGHPEKPDLLPARLELDLYAVLAPGDDVHGLAASLRNYVRVDGGAVEVHLEVIHDAAETGADAPVVLAAQAAWTAEFGPPAEINGWTGSTDGVVFRGRGIDTVRLGPQSTRSASDWRLEIVSLDQLRRFIHVYTTLLGT